MKRELFQQVKTFDIEITAKGFFEVNYKFLASVCYLICYQRRFLLWIEERERVENNQAFVFFQLASSCCVYIVIFIQFDKLWHRR